MRPAERAAARVRPAALHPLTPINVTVEITDALRALGAVEEVTVTALTQWTDPDKREDALRGSRCSPTTHPHARHAGDLGALDAGVSGGPRTRSVLPESGPNVSTGADVSSRAGAEELAAGALARA